MAKTKAEAAMAPINDEIEKARELDQAPMALPGEEAKPKRDRAPHKEKPWALAVDGLIRGERFSERKVAVKWRVDHRAALEGHNVALIQMVSEDFRVEVVERPSVRVLL